MGDKTKISWADASWNPVYGCGGCELNDGHCYAARMAGRFPDRYPGLVKDGRWTGKMELAEDRLGLPMRWKKPRRIFVNSMGELFFGPAPGRAYEYWRSIVGVMTDCPQHTFMILTKQPERIKEFVEGCSVTPNIWLGVSVTDQKTADQRIPLLLQTSAAVRFVSVEPLLGPVDLRGLRSEIDGKTRPLLTCNALTGKHTCGPWVHEAPKLDWVICGGESGPGARPMRPEWVRSLRDQCQEAKVPFFFKAWGKHPSPCVKWDFCQTNKDGLPVLDGRTWSEFPTNPTGPGGCE